jgi:hypothetical protein
MSYLKPIIFFIRKNIPLTSNTVRKINDGGIHDNYVW